ncbi:glycoside hydrolase family 16 protein [Pseudonocardia phyllosphaerae]|uniref:glycoside hydrolase family 16 protein n=1 Tax=Pseudonocardia phyllosphaerae TaxID=3390502 RepID=UPI0039786927
MRTGSAGRTGTRTRATAALTALAATLVVTAATTAGTALAEEPAASGHPAPGAAQPGTSQPGTAQRAGDAPAAPSHCTETAAQKYGWGAPTRRSDFDGNTLPPDWHSYGPEPGHDKKGVRTPDKISVGDGQMTIRSDQEGTTGAVSWHPGQRYGRWESCVKSDKASGGINALLLLWPVKENFPVGGEIDWMEITDDARQKTSFFLHYGEGNDQEYGSVAHDSTQWSAYALEWTPEKITAYVNGKEWYSTTDTSHFPPGAMNMTMQLDYFGDAGGPAAMHMDWAEQWATRDSVPATRSLAPGAAATGQPKDFPQRAPRELSGTEKKAQDDMLAALAPKPKTPKPKN